MKKSLSAIAIFFFYSFSFPMAGQGSLGQQLIHAAQSGDTVKVQSLLNKGADIEAKDDIGNTPLITAANVGNTDVTELLLKRGANIEASNFMGQTPLIMAASSGQTEVLRLLLDKGADIEARDYTKATALLAAAAKGRAEAVRLLLERNANLAARDILGENALIGAARSDNCELVEFLLAKGFPIEERNNDGATALFVAAAEEKTDSVRTLLLHGANLESRDNLGDTPLIAASSHAKSPDTVKLLLDSGADISAENNKGETAIACARRAGSNAGADLLDLTMQQLKLTEEAAQQRKLMDEANAKEPEARFNFFLSAFQQHPQDEFLREKIFQTVAILQMPPAIPETARQLFVTASGQIKQASTPAALDQPIGLLRKALEIAPWWGNAYYNLSLALEMRGQYGDAIQQLNYYLELKPAEADADKTRAHLTVLQTEKDVADHSQAQVNTDNQELTKANSTGHSLQAISEADSIWTDPATGLTWTRHDNGSDVDWYQAKEYCANLRLAGAGWRLPTIDELRGIYNPSVDVRQLSPGGGISLFHLTGDLSLTGWQWSSSLSSISGKAWYLDFTDGPFTHPFKDSDFHRALCVRRSGE